MRRGFCIATVILFFVQLGLSNSTGPEKRTLSNGSEFVQGVFIENKGQVKDQFGNLRSDVYFTGQFSDKTVLLKTNGVSYQLFRQSEQGVDIHRVDLEWIGGMTPEFEVGSKEARVSYSGSATESIQTGVFDRVNGKNLYDGVDVVWYSRNGELKYDYHLDNAVDFSKIQLKIEGTDKVLVNDAGELEIRTPLGTIVEPSPIAFQNDQEVQASWIITEEGFVSFDVQLISNQGALVIDPLVRSWGTYYGGSSWDGIEDIAIDGDLNTYVTGWAETSGTTIATTGSHQVTYGGGRDAFIAKFDADGNRVWASFYGGSDEENGNAIALDGFNGVYIAGQTASSGGTTIATAGGHQPTHGGQDDAFLVKFDTSGVRLWATYYGGDGNDEAEGCVVASDGSVYITGSTSSSVGDTISTAGSHQAAFGGGEDAFIAKFNSSGTRQWGTYYGGSGFDYGEEISVDGNGNVAICGRTTTSSGTSIASTGAHQTSYGGGSIDGFVARFNSSGVRQWGTYYGGSSDDRLHSCAIDSGNDIYVVGYTLSSSGIATSGSHDVSYNSSFDGVLVKFDASGVRQWGTYYGGSGVDVVYDVTTQGDSVLIVGYTGSSSGIATSNPNYDNSFNGGTFDAFLAEFTTSGTRQFATYFGGTQEDQALACAKTATGEYFMAGTTRSTSGIATSGAHDDSFGGGSFPNTDGFLAKFFFCTNSDVPTLTVSNDSVCLGDSILVNISGNLNDGTYWGVYTSQWSNMIDSVTTDSFYVSPSNNVTLHVRGEGGCVSGLSGSSTTIITITPPQPDLGSDTTFCINDSVIKGTTSTFTSYLWNTGDTTQTISITQAGSYQVTVQNAFGCSGIDTVVIDTFPFPQVSLGGDTSICEGESISLSGGVFASYLWNTGDTTSSLIVDTAGIYSLVVTDSNTCNASDTFILTILALPAVELGADTTICEGDSITIMAPTGLSSYQWSNATVSASIVISSGGNYAVTVTDSNACQQSDTIQVSVSNPQVDLGPDDEFCGQTTLTAQGFNAYSWSSGQSSQSITVTISDQYAVTVTDQFGCTDADTIEVTIYDLPEVDLGSNLVFCEGNRADLDAGAGFSSYQWNTGQLTQTISVNTGGTYTVTVTDANGCTNSDDVTITVLPAPEIGLEDSLVICLATITILDAGSNGTSYTWSTGEITQTIEIVGNDLGLGIHPISVEVIGSNGCSNSDTIYVRVEECLGFSQTGVEESVRVYPNPASSFLIVEFENDFFHFRIIDVFGQVVYESNYSRWTDLTLDVSDWNSGMYFLQSPEQVKLLKFIIR